jgi:hypothetical protein
MTKEDKRDIDFLARFYKVSDEVPIDEEEADATLREYGIDPNVAFRELQAQIADQDRRSKQARFAEAEAGRKAALDRLLAPRPKRSGPELRAEYNALLAQLQAQGQEAHANFKDFTSAPDEDLESLIEELKELASRGKKE